MNNKNQELLYKIHEYKKFLIAIEIIQNILDNINDDTYYRPYELIKKDLEKLEYKFYIKYEKLYEKLEKIKENLKIDDIIELEY